MKEGSHKVQYILWFYFYDMFKTGKFLEFTSSCLGLAGIKGLMDDDWGLLVFFWGNENIAALIVMMDMQFCEHTKRQLYLLDRWIVWCVNYILIELFKIIVCLTNLTQIIFYEFHHHWLVLPIKTNYPSEIIPLFHSSALFTDP